MAELDTHVLVAVAVVPNYSGGYRSSCSCGWVSPTYRIADSAKRCYTNHARESR